MEITSEPEVVLAMLARFEVTESNPPTDEQLVSIVTQLGRMAAEGPITCDVRSLVHVLSTLVRCNSNFDVTSPDIQPQNPSLNWANAIKAFDWPDRQGVETSTLKLLIAILLSCPPESEHHAVTGFWQEWKNPLSQLRLLDALLSLPSDTFNFVSLPGRRIVTVDDVATASPTIKALAQNVQTHTWNSLDLFEVLVRLADSEAPEVREFVREMFDKAVKVSAEIVHVGLLQVTVSLLFA